MTMTEQIDRIDLTDTSRSSYHVDDDFYDRLDTYTALFEQDWPVGDPATVFSAQQYLIREARLIDSLRFDDWLELFADDGLYWVPVRPGGGDPRREVSHAFDERRRLTDRVYWLNTGLAYCQTPPSRTRRTVGNVEALVRPETGETLVRANLTVHEYRPGVRKTYAAWTGHVLTDTGADGRIRLKQVNLLDSDAGHENLTLVL